MTIRPIILWTVLALATSNLVEPVLACSVCGGNPESKLAQGATQGVLVLAVIAYTLVIGMSTVLLTWVRRARRLAQLEAGQ